MYWFSMIRQLMEWRCICSADLPCYWMRGNLLLNNSISVLCCTLDEEGAGGKEVSLLICSCPSSLFLLALIRIERRQGWSTDWALCHAGTNFPTDLNARLTMVCLILDRVPIWLWKLPIANGPAHHGPSHPNQYASFLLLLASQQSASYQFQTTSLLVKIQMSDKLRLFIPCSLLRTLQSQNILLPSQHWMWTNVISDQNEQALEMS